MERDASGRETRVNLQLSEGDPQSRQSPTLPVDRFPENSTFHSSCHPASWSSAAFTCEETHGTIFSIYDLRTRRGGWALQAALRDHGEFWILNNWRDLSNKTNGYNCATIASGSTLFTPTNCNSLHHYVCVFGDVWRGNGSQCVQTSTVPSTYESATVNQTYPEPAAPYTSQNVVVVCVLVGMLLFAVAIIGAVIFKMTKRRSLHNTSSMNASLTTMSSVPEHDPDLQPESPLPMIFCTGSSFGGDMYAAAVEEIQADYYNKIDDFTTDQQPSAILTSRLPATARVQDACAGPSGRSRCGESSNSYYEIQGDISTKCTDPLGYRGEGRQSMLSTSGLYSEIDGNGTDMRRVEPDHYKYLHALNRASRTEARPLSQTNNGIYDIPNAPTTDPYDRRQMLSGGYSALYARSGDPHVPEPPDHRFNVQAERSSLLPEVNHYDIPIDFESSLAGKSEIA